MKIITKNLSKRFNREWIFKDLSIEFDSRFDYAIVGPNGSGKSTLLQILWGQMVPTRGILKYESDGKEIDYSDFYNHVSIATPYMDLIEEFTLKEMVKFHFNFKKPRGGKSIDELIEIFELNHAKNKFIHNFSSGMKQRLKLGLAFYSDCWLIFLDEPTTNLDQKSIEWYWKNLNEIKGSSLVIIASNQINEFPEDSVKIDIVNYKRGYK
jgi:ABC-type multidrug transport system ATPase subunit